MKERKRNLSRERERGEESTGEIGLGDELKKEHRDEYLTLKA